MSATLPEFATDFLGNEIKVGDTVVYPTGGTSARMVRATVRAVRDFREYCYEYEVTRWDSQRADRVPTGEKIWHSKVGYDGHRGPIAFKIVVTREQEGTRLPASVEEKRWGIDGTKKVTIDQLHRVVSVTAIARQAKNRIIEVGDDMPHVFPPSADELPPLENVPLWGDGE